MQRRLFEELVVRDRSGRGRRAGVLPVSLVLHVAVLGVVVGAPLLSPEELPPTTPSHGGLLVPALLVPAPPPPRGVSPSRLPRPRTTAPAAATPAFTVPTSWSELPPPDDVGWGLADLPVCEGCVPWGVDDGVPLAEPMPPEELPAEPAIRPGIHFEAPLKLHHVAPEYPELARTVGVQGVVIIECRVDAQGHVVDARVLRGHPLLAGSALEAVRRWRYRPTLLRGRPVAVLMTVTVRFQLR